VTKRIVAIVLILLICMSFGACSEKKEQRPTTAPQSGKPILPSGTEPNTSPNDYTAVYVTVFEDLAILASYPVEEYQGKEAECAPRELSGGVGILCGGEHEDEIPISRVLITGELVPASMAGWFRDMAALVRIDGLEKIRTHNVKDMNHLFAGCKSLSEVQIDGWDVSHVTDMTGMFDDCTALVKLPGWYRENMDVPLD
jgi:surface protein